MWTALLQMEWLEVKKQDKLQKISDPSKPRKIGSGRKRTCDIFPSILPLVENFIEPYTQVDDRRRKTVTIIEIDTKHGKGFTLRSLVDHLCANVEGLYEFGFSETAAHKLFYPPVAKTHASSRFHRLVGARRGTKKNNLRPITEGTHFARAERKCMDEFMSSYSQLNASGDDMNIIQVGRPAVSRYHQIKGFFPIGKGPNYTVHDFPNAKYGIKLGGFMVRGAFSVDRRAKCHEDIGLIHF
jgi:hypothetical protein